MGAVLCNMPPLNSDLENMVGKMELFERNYFVIICYEFTTIHTQCKGERRKR